jgi:hypothetical protein
MAYHFLFVTIGRVADFKSVTAAVVSSNTAVNQSRILPRSEWRGGGRWAKGGFRDGVF